jgi:hypothetical protein
MKQRAIEPVLPLPKMSVRIFRAHTQKLVARAVAAEVSGEFEPTVLPMHVVHREGRHASQKARAFLDCAIQRLRANLALN